MLSKDVFHNLTVFLIHEREDLKIAGCWSMQDALRRGGKGAAKCRAEGQPRLPCVDYDPGNIPGRKTSEETSRTGKTKPPPVMCPPSGGCLFYMGT